MRHLKTEATSTQGKFLTLAPNKTEKIVTFIHPQTPCTRTQQAVRMVAVHSQHFKGKQKHH